MLGKFTRWIVYSNIWVSLSVVAFVVYGQLLDFFPTNFPYLFLVFSATLFAYNFQRLLKVNSANPAPSERHIWIQKYYYWIRLLTILAGISAAILGLTILRISDVIFAVPLIAIVLLYVGNKWIKLSIRLIPYLKIVAISLVWTFVVFIFPIIQNDAVWTNAHRINLVMIFMFTFALCIPFDIRDLKSDKGNVLTIPSALGVFRSKLLAGFLIVIVMAFAMYLKNWSFVSTCLVGLVFIAKTEEKNADLFFTAGIDGLFLLLPIFHWMLQFFDLL